MATGRGAFRRWLLLGSAVILVAVSAIAALNWWNDQSKEFTAIPPNVEFVSSSGSQNFTVEAVITLRHAEAGGRRLVTFEVKVENRTDKPIRRLLVTAELPVSLRSYSGGQSLIFGQMDAMDLVPGQVPYGLIVTREQSLPDPYSMSIAERDEFYEALRQPIRAGLWWEDGEEYLTLSPEEIEYIGFPGMGALESL